MSYVYRLISKIDGIHCQGCINRINSKIMALGAKNIDLEIPLNLLKIDYVGLEADANKFIAAINDLGYKAERIALFDPEEVYNSFE